MKGRSEHQVAVTTPDSWAPPSSELFPYCAKRATKDGADRLSPSIWAELLLWPKMTGGVPAFYRDFATRWCECVYLPHRVLAPTAAAAVLNVIMKSLAWDYREQEWNAPLNSKTIALAAHVDVRTVTRVTTWQLDSRVPLLKLSRPGLTGKIHHQGYRFALVLSPLEFAQARDAARAQRVEQARADLEGQRPDLLALQAQLLREQISQDDYNRRAKELAQASRGKLPARVSIQPRYARPVRKALPR